MKGWVYVMSNVAMPGILKIGFSMKDPNLRAADLGNTGVPHPYVVEFEVLVEAPAQIEQEVHRSLANVRDGKEWFSVTLPEAIDAIKDIVGDQILFEQFPTVIAATNRSREKPVGPSQKEQFVETNSSYIEKDRISENLYIRQLYGGLHKVVSRGETEGSLALTSLKENSYELEFEVLRGEHHIGRFCVTHSDDAVMGALKVEIRLRGAKSNLKIAISNSFGWAGLSLRKMD
jgi:hypothetical protein